MAEPSPDKHHLKPRDRWFLIVLPTVVVCFAAISIAVNALAPDVPTTSNSTAVDQRVQDSEYVLHLGRSVPSITQGQAIAMGRAACSALDAGSSRPTVIASITEQGITSAQAAQVLTAAVASYCPQHRAA
jgi:hypothetical protein